MVLHRHEFDVLGRFVAGGVGAHFLDHVLIGPFVGHAGRIRHGAMVGAGIFDLRVAVEGIEVGEPELLIVDPAEIERLQERMEPDRAACRSTGLVPHLVERIHLGSRRHELLVR